VIFSNFQSDTNKVLIKISQPLESHGVRCRRTVSCNNCI